MSDQNTNAPEVSEDVIEVEFENGSKEMVTVPRMKLGCYEACFTARKAGKEFRFLELALNKPAGWAIVMTPPSYTAINNAVCRKNTDFFVYLAMRQSNEGMMQMVAGAASRGSNSLQG